MTSPRRTCSRLSAVSAIFATVLTGALLMAPALADDEQPGKGPKAESKTSLTRGDEPRTVAAANFVKRLERHRKKVADAVEASKLADEAAAADAAQTAASRGARVARAAVDEATLEELKHLIAAARKLAEPLTVDDLTDDEKESLYEELKEEFEAEGDDGPAAQLNAWQERALQSAFDGADLSEEQEIASRDILQGWFKKSMAARSSGDSKGVSDLKRARDKALKKSLGKSKARKVINNLNSMASWRGGGR